MGLSRSQRKAPPRVELAAVASRTGCLAATVPAFSGKTPADTGVGLRAVALPGCGRCAQAGGRATAVAESFGLGAWTSRGLARDNRGLRGIVGDEPSRFCLREAAGQPACAQVSGLTRNVKARASKLFD